MPRNCYPWEAWFRSHSVVLRRGKDYASATSTMAQIVRNNASRLGVSVSIREVKGGLKVTVRKN